MKILVTGGAGFIGSHIIDYLLKEHEIVCIDDLSLGRIENIKHNKSNPRFKFVKMDILKKNPLEKIFRENKFDCVFHMAANSDIQEGAANLEIDLKKTFMTTFNVLLCMKDNNVKNIVFASTSAIYGEQEKQLSEDTGSLFPISFYGAAKLSSEAYISAFSANFGINAWIFRFPNVVGERATHGVIFDFIKKLQKNPSELVILGNGEQEKPYMYVKDLVEGIIFGWKNSNERINCFNLGVSTATKVHKIAETVVRRMGLRNVELKYTGGDRGWVGDVPQFSYDISKINKLGWKARRNSNEAIDMAVDAQLKLTGAKKQFT